MYAVTFFYGIFYLYIFYFKRKWIVQSKVINLSPQNQFGFIKAYLYVIRMSSSMLLSWVVSSFNHIFSSCYIPLIRLLGHKPFISPCLLPSIVQKLKGKWRKCMTGTGNRTTRAQEHVAMPRSTSNREYILYPIWTNFLKTFTLKFLT